MAERLTMQEVIEHCDKTKELMERVFARVRDGGEFGQIESKRYLEHKQTAEWLRELQKYKDLEEQGRLIELPCKIGDTVYGSFRCYDGNKINECKVIGIRACKLKANSECYYLVDVEFNIIDPFYNDGRLMFFKRQAVVGNNYGNWERVFFTKEEAEAALKGR